MTQKNLKSFTLIEMLLVVAIIGILSSILLFNAQDAFDEEERMKILTFGESLKGKNQESLVSEWTFDGPTEAGLSATANDVRDSWGYNNGTVSGGPIVKDGDFCISGKCLSFDGVDDYIDCGNDHLILIEKFTLSQWVLKNSSEAGNIINKNSAYRTQASSNGSFYFGMKDLNDVHRLDVYSLSAFTIGKWYYYVVTWDAPNWKIYVNGILDKEGTWEYLPKNDTSNVTIGGPLYPFKGLIDNVLIYNKALSISEMRRNYVAGLDSLLAKNLISEEEYDNKIMNLATNE